MKQRVQIEKCISPKRNIKRNNTTTDKSLSEIVKGFMEWGFMCGCWFQGVVRTGLPRTALPLDRIFPLPPQNSFFSSLGCRVKC